MHVSKQSLSKYIYFIKRARLKRNITVARHKKRFSLHCPYIGIIIYDNACNIIKGSPNDVILAIIAFCSSFDEICLLTHYIQSYEFLYYTDTLRKKQRAFVRRILPYIPPKSTIESKKILLFQKFIRDNFKYNFKVCLNKINSVSKSKTHKIFKRINKFSKVFYNVFVEDDLSKSKRLSSRISDQSDYKHRIYKIFGFRKRCKSICNVVKSYSLACVSTLGRNVAKIRNVRQKYDDVIFNNLSEILEHYPELSGDLSTAFHRPSDTVLHSKFYEKFKDNKHLEDILCVVDLLAHYIFTINSCKNVCMDHLSQINVSRYYTFEYKLCERGSVNRHMSESHGLDVVLRKVIRSLNYARNLTHRLKELSYPLNESPMKIIKEILESCIIFINSSKFDESYYYDFLMRLSIAQAMDGYLILAYSLINRSLNDFNYANRVNVNNIDLQCSLEIDYSFKLKMLNKIVLKLADHTKNYGIKPVSSNRYIKKYLLGLNFDKHVLSSDDPHGVMILATNKHYTDAKLLLMAGVSYLRQALILPPAASGSITDMGITTLYVDTHAFGTLECIVFTGRNEIGGAEFVNTDYMYSYESCLGLAVDNILKSLAIDPLDYKSWLYLAHCGLFSHNLQFSHACAKRCIDCYDMCLPAWLILIISMSSRIRSCSPFKIDKTVFDEYIMSKTNMHNHPPNDMVQIKAIPPPFEPILISEIEDVEHLDSYFNNSIGGNINICISTIESILYHDCTYLNTAFLQILFRDSEFYNPLFLWEKEFFSRRSTKSNVMAMTILTILKMCKGDAIEQNVNILSMKKYSINEPFDTCYCDIKKTARKIYERRLHVCVVPFMSVMTNILLDKSYNFRCNNHKNQTCSKSPESNIKALEEEIYAWITCIETLSQIEEHVIARLLLPVLDVYLDSYGSYLFSKRDDKFGTDFSANKFESSIVNSFDRTGSIAVDLRSEADYLKYYIKCCNASGESKELGMILREIHRNGYVRYRRKVLLLETRLLVGLKLYNDTIQLSNLIHRANVKLSPDTDVVLEYQSLKAYALALEKTGDTSRSNFVKAFARQYYLTTPLIKYGLCLNVPL